MARPVRGRICFFLHGVILLVTWSWALAQSGSSMQPPQGKLTLAGTVINSVTGEPIPRALVTLAYPANAVLSGPDGTFQFGGLAEGNIAVLLAQKPGFLSTEEMGGSSQIKIGPQGATSTATLKLVPEAVIFGKVEDENGEALEGAVITLSSNQIMNGRKRRLQVGSRNTDEEGVFRIAGLAPGVYYVAVHPNLNFARGGRLQPDREDGYASIVYYPGVTDVAAATPIQLAAGQRAPVNFSLKPQPNFQIRGVVTGQAPGQQLMITLASSAGEMAAVSRLFDQQSGRFQIRNVTPGSYVLHLQSIGGGPGAARRPLYANVPINVNADISGIQIALEPGTTIPMVVRSEFTQTDSQSASRVTIMNGGSTSEQDVEIQLAQVYMYTAEDSTLYQTQSFFSTMEEHTLAVRNVVPGKYVVIVNPARGYVQSAMCGSTNLLREELAIGGSSATPPIEILLRDDGASVQGTVRYEGDPRQILVLAIRDAAPMQAPMTFITAAADGKFYFGNLAPGSYRFLALERGDNVEYQNPEVMGRYLARATQVTLEPNGNSTISLNMVQRSE